MPPSQEDKTAALWAIREGDLDRLKVLVEQKGVKVTEAGPDGKSLSEDMTLWAGGPVSDYVSLRVAFENASILSAPRAQNTDAPAAASFRKRAPHGPG